MNEQMRRNNTLLSILTPGDHIACVRKSNLFEHHGIYIGEVDGVHKVTHFKAPMNESKVDVVQPVAQCTLCGYTPQPNGGIVNSCLDCFIHLERIYVIKYKVPLQNLDPKDLSVGKVLRGYRTDKLYLELYRDGKMVGHVSIRPEEMKNQQADDHVFLSKFHSCRSPWQVVEAAQSNHYVGKYNLMFNNCEDFAVQCMIGKARSIQSEKRLHRAPYKVGKTLHLFTDRRKMKDKLKEKALRFLARSS